MIVDVRTYHIKPGKMPQELDLYAKRGLASQTRHLVSNNSARFAGLNWRRQRMWVN